MKVGQSGVLCSENTPENMASKIKQLLSNEETYEKYSTGAKNWADKFTWEKSRKLSLGLLDKLFT